MRASRRTVSVVFLTFSFLGLTLIAALATVPLEMQDDVYERRPLVGAAFSIVCILGILAGMFPSRCSGIAHFRTAKQKQSAQESAELPKEALDFRGHHPDCGNFSAHVVRVGGGVVCAGCLGLILGAVLSLFGTAWYFFLHLPLGMNYVLVFWVGFVGVSCGLLQYHLFNWGRSSVHLSVNTFFVFGVFWLLAGVDAIVQSTIVDVYLIALSVFWLYTRILLSQLDHDRICTACSIEECGLYRRKSVESG